MAAIALKPATLNVQIRRGAYQQFKSSPVLNFSDTAVNLSTFFSMTAKLVAQSPTPNTADVTFGAATGDASGIITLVYDSSDLPSNPIGAANLVILGVPASGDDPQVIATGSATLSNG